MAAAAAVLDASALLAYLQDEPGGAIDAEPFATADAIDVARLRPLTRTAGLSVADRACSPSPAGLAATR